MTKKYIYAHVKESEERKFGDWEAEERQMRYLQAVQRRDAQKTVKELKKILMWKFDSCLLSTKELKGLL